MVGRVGRAASSAWRVGVILAAMAAGAGSATAQSLDEIALARMFGAGVHAYFSGDYARSHADLTAVVAAGCQDPRAFYFRGLSALRLGLCHDAEADFAAGADLEATPLANWPVSQALERVQGADRLVLERYRARARVTALQLDQAAEQKRYSGIALAQPDVLRKRSPAPAPPVVGKDNVFDGRPAVPPVAPEPGPDVTVPGGDGEAASPDAATPDADSTPPETDVAPPGPDTGGATGAAEENAADLEPEMETTPGAPASGDSGSESDVPNASDSGEPASDGEADTPLPGAGDANAGEAAGGDATMPEEPVVPPVDVPAAGMDEAGGNEAGADEAGADEAGGDAAGAGEPTAEGEAAAGESP